MTTPDPAPAQPQAAPAPAPAPARRLNLRLLPLLVYLILAGSLAAVSYWLFLASDRYVSEASIIIRKTDSATMATFDLGMLVTGAPGANRPDQLLLREYLLSQDMVKKIDAALGLRAHYSDRRRDWISRLWLPEVEWFHRHYLARTAIEYDEYAGVLRLRAQAYDPAMARAVTAMLVDEGERYMNQLGHEMARTQVEFLTTQVEQAQQRVRETNQHLLAFQNAKGLLSPRATADSVTGLIAVLDQQRAQVQTQLAALPRDLDADHPNLRMLRQSLAALDQQIANEKAKLADPAGQPLNATLEEFQRLQLDASFAQEVYKAAFTALEKGRIDATRMLLKVSVMQAPTTPEHPQEPRRIYNTIVTALLGLMLAGIVKLLNQIILDHVD